MRELWLKIDRAVSKGVAEKILCSAGQVCDAIYVVDGWRVSDLKKTGVRVAAEGGECDIQVFESFNMENL